MTNNNSKIRMPLTIIGAILLFVGCLWVLRAALAPFFAAMVFAYLLWPVYRYFNKRMGQTLSALIAISCGLLAGAATVWIVFGVFAGQVQRMIATIPQLKATFETRLVPWLQGYPWIMEKVQAALDSFDPMLFLRGISGAGLGVVGWILQALSFALAPLIAYYVFVDGQKWLGLMESLVPSRFRAAVRDVLREINERLGGFIRGEMLVAICMSFLQGLAFAVLGVPYAWLLGLIAGFSNVVPYSPYVTALPLALLIAAFEGAGWGWITGIAFTFFMVQKIEGFYLTPIWVGRASHLHPLEVLLALLCFGFAFGVLGLIFAIPLMIVTKVITKKLLEIYRSHPWFEKE